MNCDIAGVILAGGLSRRMGGGDKGLLAIAGTAMLSRVIDRLRPQARAIALNANGDPARFSAFDLPVIADPVEGFAGPLAGVLAGLNWAAGLQTPPSHIVTVASDTPFFPIDLADRLLAANEERDDRIVLAASDGNRHPVFGLWPLGLRGPLAAFMAATDTYKVLAFVREHDHRIADFPLVRVGEKTLDPFFNANTPDDIEIAERIVLETTH